MQQSILFGATVHMSVNIGFMPTLLAIVFTVSLTTSEIQLVASWYNIDVRRRTSVRDGSGHLQVTTEASSWDRSLWAGPVAARMQVNGRP